MSIPELYGKAIEHRLFGRSFLGHESFLARPTFLLRVSVAATTHEQVYHLTMDGRESLQMTR